MTPYEFRKKMILLKRNVGRSEEECHIKMDALMCQLLEELGYGKGVKVFKDTYKWYA